MHIQLDAASANALKVRQVALAATELQHELRCPVLECLKTTLTRV